jgi:2,5-diketo-D-gluconate reductase B
MSILFQKTNQRVFGTFPLTGEKVAAAIREAAEVGYRAFDTAQMYGNETDVGAALAQTGIHRDDLCIITKVHPNNYDSVDQFLASVERSLINLQIDIVDILFLHWPPIGGNIRKPLHYLEEARARGLTREIGVSNFNAAMMREARQTVIGPIAANQIEFHPLLDQRILLDAASETNIPLFAYSSIARGEVFKYDLFFKLASDYGKTPAQIVLRWILQKGVIANTMSTKPENIRANFDVMNFILSAPDMAKIDELARVNYRVVTSAKAPWAPFWD